MKKPLDLSVIVTAHSEGILLHKTLLSIKKALKLLDGSYSYELILHLDNPTQDTLYYLEKHADLLPKQTVIYRNSFKDLSASRNFSIEHSFGRYIAICDGDDLYSKTIYIHALELLERDAKNKRKIVHPKYIISFDDHNLIDEKMGSNGNVIDTLRLFNENILGSNCVAHRDTFLKHKYQPNSNLYGYEDMLFNADTLSDGYSHVVTNDVRFYRRKKQSLLKSQVDGSAELRKTKLFDFDRIKEMDIKQLYDSTFTKQAPPDPPRIVRAVSLLVRIAKEYHLANQRASKKYKATVSQLTNEEKHKVNALIAKQVVSLERYPNWLIKEWFEMHEIEQKIFPSKALLTSIRWYEGHRNIKPGLVYASIVKQLSKKPDTVMFVPWIIRGGADKVFVNYANELSKQKHWDIAILQTNIEVKSVWADRLDKNIDFADISSSMKQLNHNTQMRVLIKFIVQNDIKRIIIANSWLGFEVIQKYQKLLEEIGVTIYTFAFAEGFEKDGKRMGHVHTHLPHVYESLYRVIADNKNVISQLSKEYGITTEKFSVHYQPAAVDMKVITSVKNKKPLRILWASRVCRSKCPEILKQIANRLDPSEYIIDVYGSLEEDYTKEFFENSNLNYKRPFDGIKDIPTDDYDIFLYTSESDGTPSMLQEMTAMALPIVASNAGGVGEFILDGVTGKLVEDYTNIDQYIEAIKNLADPNIRKKIVKNAQSQLNIMFSEKTWRENIKNDFDK